MASRESPPHLQAQEYQAVWEGRQPPHGRAADQAAFLGERQGPARTGGKGQVQRRLLLMMERES